MLTADGMLPTHRSVISPAQQGAITKILSEVTPIQPKDPQRCLSGLLSIAVKKTMTKNILRREEYVWFIYPSHSPSMKEGKAHAGLELRQRSESNAVYWLAPQACSPRLAPLGLLSMLFIPPTMTWTSHIHH